MHLLKFRKTAVAIWPFEEHSALIAMLYIRSKLIYGNSRSQCEPVQIEQTKL